MLRIFDLQTEHLDNPTGVDTKAPRFSWKLESDRKNVIQNSYRIQVKGGEELLWDSGKVESSQSQYILYEGKRLESARKASWNVWVEAGGESAESDTAWFEMALLDPEDWRAKWIEPEDDIQDLDQIRPAVLLRKKFFVREGLKRARIYQSAHGLYEFWINGTCPTQDKFKPGFTSYYHRIQYQNYDITEFIKPGENEWLAELADGWWRGISGGCFRNNFGYKLGFIGQIMLEYENGAIEYVISDESFETCDSPLRMSDMKMGDIYDARVKCETWRPVHLERDAQAATRLLIPSRSVPVREKERFLPKVLRDENGDTVLDFGQNIAGYVEMTLRGCREGQKISLQHGEDMRNGVFYVGNMMFDGLAGQDHLQTVDYICKGDEVERYKPRFSVFGFRYVRVTGYDHDIDPGDFVAVAVYSDCRETGEFQCSNDLINRLVSNSRWSQKGNFLDVPTDCPTRERSPWSGDAQLYAKTASLFMDVYPFFEKWMLDQKAEQLKDGMVLSTFPSTNTMQNPQEVRRHREKYKNDPERAYMFGDMEHGNPSDGSAGWGDVAVILPYVMYLCYGDVQILKNQYPSAKKWVDYMRNRAKEHNLSRENEPQYHTMSEGVLDADYMWDTGFQYGEWLEADWSQEDVAKFGEAAAVNPDNEVPTAFLCYSSRLLSKMAAILGYDKEEKEYLEYSERVRKMFNKYIIHPDGSIKPGRQAPNVRALAFGLAEGEKKEKVAERLLEYIRDQDYHLNTGFLSTPYLLSVLTDTGHADYAFRLLEQETSPGWLYNVKAGATTILETWTGMDTHQMSFNHYSYGAVCDYLFSYVAGIRPDEAQPGYRHFFIRPVIGGSLDHAAAEYECVYGKIRSEWKRKDGKIEYRLTVPANTTATFVPVNGSPEEIGSGEYIFVR